jgi:hypothetical protein
MDRPYNAIGVFQKVVPVIEELKAQLARLWERGELLRDAVTGHERFPLRLAIKPPTSADITDRFNEVRTWVAELSGEWAPPNAVRVEWESLADDLLLETWHTSSGYYSDDFEAEGDDFEAEGDDVDAHSDHDAS